MNTLLDELEQRCGVRKPSPGKALSRAAGTTHLIVTCTWRKCVVGGSIVFMAGHDRDGVREECERTFRDVNSTGDVSFGAVKNLLIDGNHHHKIDIIHPLTTVVKCQGNNAYKLSKVEQVEI
jgi:hypothetical protein